MFGSYRLASREPPDENLLKELMRAVFMYIYARVER